MHADVWLLLPFTSFTFFYWNYILFSKKSKKLLWTCDTKLFVFGPKLILPPTSHFFVFIETELNKREYRYSLTRALPYFTKWDIFLKTDIMLKIWDFYYIYIKQLLHNKTKSTVPISHYKWVFSITFCENSLRLLVINCFCKIVDIKFLNVFWTHLCFTKIFSRENWNP